MGAAHISGGHAKSATSIPKPEQVRKAREAAGLTQQQAAQLIHGTVRAWQEWEAGNRRMHPGLFELFLLKTEF
jgi:DNA-binding transcriptional regulator YiaG